MNVSTSATSGSVPVRTIPVAVSSAVVTVCGVAVGAVLGEVTVRPAEPTLLQLPATSRARTDTMYEPGATVGGTTPVNDPAESDNRVALPTPGSAPIHHSPPARPDSASDVVAVIALV